MRYINTILSILFTTLCFTLASCAGGTIGSGPQVATHVTTVAPVATGGTQAANSPSGANAPAPSNPTTGTTTPVVTPAGSHTLTFVNNCKQTVWAGALSNGKEFPLPDKGGWLMDPGQSHAIVLAGHWGGRFWGRTGCATTAGAFKCDSGDCGGATCDGRGGQPASLAEFLLYDDAGKDFYDVSLVDGFNLPIGIAPSAGTLPAAGVSGQFCGSPTCATDIDALCPAELQQKNAAGTVVACLSACSEYNTPQTCCSGDYDKPAMCPPTTLSTTFKTACHDAYSYAYDDKTSTYNCTATGYTITFCPTAASGL